MLNTVFGTVGAIVTAVVYMVSPGRQVWWLPLMLIGSYLAVALLYLLLLAVVSLFLPRREGGPDHPFVNALIARTLAWAFGFIGRRIRLTGRGRQLEDKARFIADKTLKEALRGLSQEELNTCQETLRIIFNNSKS